MEQERRNLASMLLERAWKIARRIRDPYFRLEAYLEIARVPLAVGDRTRGRSFLERAVRSARRIKSDFPGIAAHGMVKIAGVFLEAGETHRAREILEEAIKMARSLVGYPDDQTDALREAGLLFSALGEQEKGRALLYEALEDAEIILLEKDRQWAYYEIGEAFLKIGDVDGAQAAVNKITLYWRDDILAGISTELARRGEVESALKIVEAIKESDARMKALCGIARGLMESQEPGTAEHS